MLIIKILEDVIDVVLVSFIVNFEQILQIILVFPQLTLNK